MELDEVVLNIGWELSEKQKKRINISKFSKNRIGNSNKKFIANCTMNDKMEQYYLNHRSLKSSMEIMNNFTGFFIITIT